MTKQVVSSYEPFLSLGELKSDFVLQNSYDIIQSGGKNLREKWNAHTFH